MACVVAMPCMAIWLCALLFRNIALSHCCSIHDVVVVVVVLLFCCCVVCFVLLLLLLLLLLNLLLLVEFVVAC